MAIGGCLAAWPMMAVATFVATDLSCGHRYLCRLPNQFGIPHWPPGLFGGPAMAAKTVWWPHVARQDCLMWPLWLLLPVATIVVCKLQWFFFPVILGNILIFCFLEIFFKILYEFYFVDPADNTFFKCNPYQINSQFYLFQNSFQNWKYFQNFTDPTLFWIFIHLSLLYGLYIRSLL